MNITSMEAATGMPSGKKTHRGKRSRGHGAKAKHEACHEDLNAAMACGDHAAAKSSALSLVKALHAMQKPKPESLEPTGVV